MEGLLQTIRDCDICAQALPLGPRPILAASHHSRILIIGQAPGRKVHESGVAWRDPSGVQLRRWMGISEERFYDPRLVAIVPMGFCYPGTGKSGDLPPRPECAPTWHERLLEAMPERRLTLLVGQYAQRRYLAERMAPTLTETVRHFADFLADGLLPLPHPSPRNRFWLAKNPWFEAEVVPRLRQSVSALCAEA